MCDIYCSSASSVKGRTFEEKNVKTELLKKYPLEKSLTSRNSQEVLKLFEIAELFGVAGTLAIEPNSSDIFRNFL